MAVNKCNITKYVLDIINRLYSGLSCKKDNDSIYENYAQYLNCSTVEIIPCHADVCNNDPIQVSCLLLLDAILFDSTGNLYI